MKEENLKPVTDYVLEGGVSIRKKRDSRRKMLMVVKYFT